MKKLLYLDDSADLREIVQEVLADRFETIVVEDVKQAITSLKEERFDIILLDYNLEETNSLGVVHFLEKENFQIPLLFFTSQSYEFLSKRLNYKNFRGVITKPITDILGSILELTSENISK